VVARLHEEIAAFRAERVTGRVEIGDGEREVILVGRPVFHSRRTLVDEDLRVTGREEGAARPLGDRRRADERSVERRHSGDVVGEQCDLGDAGHVAISNSRSTSFSEVLRSVESLRVPTMRAHGRSYDPAGNVFGLVPGSTTERGGT